MNPVLTQFIVVASILAVLLGIHFIARVFARKKTG